MRMHFTTLVKYPKKVFQGLVPHTAGGMRSLPGVARGCTVLGGWPLSCGRFCGYPGCLLTPSQQCPSHGLFPGRGDPRAPP